MWWVLNICSLAVYDNSLSQFLNLIFVIFKFGLSLLQILPIILLKTGLRTLSAQLQASVPLLYLFFSFDMDSIIRLIGGHVHIDISRLA